MEKNIIYSADAYEFIKTLPTNSIDLIIADPPSGAGLTKAVWDKKISHFKYGDLISFFNKDCFTALKETGSYYLAQWVGEKNPVHIDYVKIKTELLTALKFKEQIIWQKQRGNGNRKGWLQVTEYLLWYVKDNKKFKWNVENQYSDEKRLYTITGSKNKSEYKRLTSVWNIKELGFGTCPKNFKKEREKFGKHETPKPPEYFERIILAHTNPGDVVFIPFSGTGVAEDVCKKLDRNFISCELSI